MFGRTRWAVSFLVAALTAAGVGLATLGRGDGDGGDACEEWRARYEAALETLGVESGATGTLDFINLGPLAELEASRPEGCGAPGQP